MISVIVPAYNVERVLPAALACLERQTFRGEWEILLADNGSSDGTREVALAWQDRLPILTVIDASARRGAGAARNIAAERARGDRLAFCDSDDLVSPGWLEAYDAALTECSIATGPIGFFRDGTEPPDLEGGFTDAPPIYRGWLPYGFGCNLAITASLFRRLEGFEEVTPSGEDVDLCLRAQLAGERFCFVHDARVLKRQNAGFWRKFRQHRGYGVSDAILLHRFVPLGLPKPGWYDRVRPVGWLALHLLDLLHSERRLVWAAVAGDLTGGWAQKIHARAAAKPESPNRS